MGEPERAEGRGPVAALIATLAAALANPPVRAERVMAFALDPAGRGDHLGLQLGGQPTPGGLDLLAGAIAARARPRATVLLEWTLTGETSADRHYRGWAVWQEAGELAWRRLSGAEVQNLPDRRTGQTLGADPRAHANG